MQEVKQYTAGDRHSSKTYFKHLKICNTCQVKWGTDAIIVLIPQQTPLTTTVIVHQGT